MPAEMRAKLSSRDRMLQAINHREPDHIPLYLKWWERPFLSDKSQGWRNQFERADSVLHLGLEDTVGFDVPRPMSEDVKMRVWKERPAGERWPLLFKEYETPKGTLRQVVRQTSDWPHGDDIPIFSDFLAPSSRSVKYLVQEADDLEALSCLFRDPNDEEMEAFREGAERVREFAEERQILVECGMYSEGGRESAIFGADALPWLCGFENVMRRAFRDPNFVRRLLEIVHEWDMRYLDALLELGFVDIIVHRGWYENADFWSPSQYKRFIEPYVSKLVDRTHRAGAKFCYIMSMKQMPLLGIMKEIDVDILYGLDPVQGGTDLALAKKSVGDSICLCGGVNSAVTLNSGTPEEIRKAVTDCVKILAPGGGFILSSIDQIFEDTPWKNIQILIDTWSAKGSYSGT
jgi:hypothetical protein